MVRDWGRETGTEEFDMRRFRRPLPAPLTIPMDLVEKLVLQNTGLKIFHILFFNNLATKSRRHQNYNIFHLTGIITGT